MIRQRVRLLTAAGLAGLLLSSIASGASTGPVSADLTGVGTPTPTATPSSTPFGTTSSLAGVTPSATAGAPTDPRYFAETGFSVDSSLYDFFLRHGGARTFGPPISNRFRLLSHDLQLFRRHAIEQRPDGTIAAISLLDLGIAPTLHLAGWTFPAADATLTAAMPVPGTAGYDALADAFVQAHVPADVGGQPVGFAQLFAGTVTFQDAPPGSLVDAGHLPVLRREVWGLPTSGPFRDPQNTTRILLRWERGVMVYDSSTGAADAVPLGELLRELLTGDSRATDGAPAFLRQYDPTAPNGVARPIELADTVLQGAFQPTAAPSLAQPAGPAAIATATPSPTPSDKCYGDEQISFAPEEPRIGIELLIAVTSAHPHPYSRLYGTESTIFSRERPGQLGTVWEYTVNPTLVGKHQYTFYVDGTIPCVSASVRVSGLPTTSTPRPARDRSTATPYPTAWFPTPTATSTTRP